MDSVQEMYKRSGYELYAILVYLSGEITLQFNFFFQCEDTDIQQRKLKLEKFIYKNGRCREPKKKKKDLKNQGWVASTKALFLG